MSADVFRFDGKRAVVVGGATGMGAATAALVRDLGADTTVLDIAPVTLDGVATGTINLADKASTDAAVDALEGPIHALFLCAGVADGTPGIERINFIAQRHVIDRCLERDLLPRGSAIGMISSAAGMGWEAAKAEVDALLDTPDWDAAMAWTEANPNHDHYMWTKQAMCGYVARASMAMLRRGIRLNAVMPGPTVTPLAQANADMWLTFGEDFRAEVGIEASTPEEQAGPLVFLCSDAAAYVNGITMITDAGYAAAGTSGSFEPAVPVIDFLMGRLG